MLPLFLTLLLGSLVLPSAGALRAPRRSRAPLRQRPCPQAGAVDPSAAPFPAAPAVGLGSAADVRASMLRASTPAGVWPPSAASRAVAAAAVARARLAVDPNSTDCQAALLMWEYAIALRPDLAPFADAFYSLRLDAECGAPPPTGTAAEAAAGLAHDPSAVRTSTWSAARVASECDARTSVHVAPAGDDARIQLGSAARPAATLHGALAAVRAARAARAARSPLLRSCVILHAGVHFLGGQTVTLGSADSGLAFLGAPGEAPVWVSGGAPLLGLSPWVPHNTSGGANIWKTVLPSSFPLAGLAGGLNTASPHTRLSWAQFPNFDIETGSEAGEVQAPWGGGGAVSEWHKGVPHELPTVYWRSLAGLLNASTMDCYNHYSDGSGGPCAHWRGRGSAQNYFCGNSSDGGWVEVDALMNQQGLLPFPLGMTYNTTFVPNIDAWQLPPLADPRDWTNAPTLTVWQGSPGGGGGWYNNRFAIIAHDATTHFLNLTADGVWPSGGWQGGRVWHTLDAPQGGHAGPLIGGNWHVNGVFAELDAPGEYWYDAPTRTLYLYYNVSVVPPGVPPPQPGSPPPASLELIAPVLEVFFNVSGMSPEAPASDVVFAGLAFRDQREGMLSDWMIPSGGDWALRRTGAVLLENTESATVEGCAFVRTDGNAVMLNAYNRNASVLRSEFAWIGMSALALMGDCDHDDCTGAAQPWGTLLAGCVVRELGIVEKQSSALFLGKAALTRAEGNIFFNGPRAMINVNDLVGGGHNLTGNAMWATCRESGDHGPINSWHRSPFANTIATGGVASSYASLPSVSSHNFIDAGYGGSQAFDTDDGSSYLDIHDNFYMHSDMFKTDYGGHSSSVHGNVVVVRVYDGQACINGGDFVPTYETSVFGNTCILPPAGSNGHDSELVDPNLGGNACQGLGPGQGALIAHTNAYYTLKGNATARCGDGTEVSVLDLPPPMEAGSSAGTLPNASVIIAWGRAKIGM